MSAATTTQAKVDGIIDDNPVGACTTRPQAEPRMLTKAHPAVFSKSYCPYCRASKSLLTEMGAKFYAIELDQVDDGSDIQSTLASMTGQSTVPNIFINKKHIGGNSDLQGKRKELPQLLKEAGAV